MQAKKLNPGLWEDAKKQVMEDGKPWNARKAQMAVKIYKSSGGRYAKSVPREKTSLNKWTREDWKYVSKDSERYLPSKVIDNMSPAEKAAASRGKRLGERKKYGPELLSSMRNR